MRFMILRMLSSASLSAFSASVQARARGNIPLGDAPLAGVTPVRGQADARPGTAAPGASGMSLAPAPARPPADRTLPRGSLLDLSV